ncbi:MAG: aminodeoxychorismate/anthranilate synthase component II [Cyclobacteriaceae bacterium]
MKTLVLDNYDSFTYNLVHILRELDVPHDVYRNDKISIEEAGLYDRILLSPGPGVPSQAGIMPELIKKYSAEKNILGVCLGHQAIAEAFDSKIYNLPEVYHGIATQVVLTDETDALFDGLPGQFKVCRYHSWSVEPKSLSPDLVITSRDENGQIMSLKHKKYNVRGVQFHPESILTEHGKEMIRNWITI